MTIPNVITLGRLLSVPLAIWLILDGADVAAFWLFIAAGVSDGIDGWIAKRFDQKSELGALLDPLADKALLVAVYVTLGWQAVLPSWLVILVVARDIMILGGYLLSGTIGEAPRASPLYVSKINTVFQIGLAGLTLGGRAYGLMLDPVRVGLIWAVGLTTSVSGAAYLARWAGDMSGKETGS